MTAAAPAPSPQDSADAIQVLIAAVARRGQELTAELGQPRDVTAARVGVAVLRLQEVADFLAVPTTTRPL